ncbi:SCO family protein [Methylocystis heyeri]|uniref:SCO family protein n=1 Tax=Methylocystis heyeri TaxID=391905 RepID=A0A6B8KJN1_9HYPH|nr:SCO family protein [Methylocystis heyeri]QGM46800.1 SCO family protein [Methylocystis heyeri]
MVRAVTLVAKCSEWLQTRPAITGFRGTAIACAAGVALLGTTAFHTEPAPRALFQAAFRLTSHDGEVIDTRDLLGRPYAVFFGFTHCPGMCATTLSELSELLRMLGSRGDRLKVYFVTLDAQRDNPKILSEYLHPFGPAFVGLTGSQAEVEATARSFQVYFRKIKLDDGDYAFDHSPLVYLVDMRGHTVGLLSLVEQRDAAVAKLEALLDVSSAAGASQDAWRAPTSRAPDSDAHEN